jgi:opacity protein-like surface antigen
MLTFMRTIFAAIVPLLLCAAQASAQSPLAPANGKTIDLGLGYSYVSQGESLSGPLGLNGGDASVTIGYSRFGLKADFGYARSSNIGGTQSHNTVRSYLVGPVFHATFHHRFDTYAQVLVGAARVSGPVPLGGGSYLLGGWAAGSAWAVGGGVDYRVSDSIAIRSGVDYMRTSYFDSTLALRGQGNIRSTVTILYSFVKRSRKRRLA